MLKEENTKNILSKAALATGISLIIMTLLSFVIFASLKVSFYSVLGISVIIILDLIVAVSLFVLLEGVNRSIAMIMSLLRIVYGVIFAVALYNISDLASFHSIWNFGLLIFGLHLFFLAFLVYKSNYIPKYLGIFLFLSALSYVVDSVLVFFNYDFSIAVFTFWSEPLLAIWLLIKNRIFLDK